MILSSLKPLQCKPHFHFIGIVFKCTCFCISKVFVKIFLKLSLALDLTSGHVGFERSLDAMAPGAMVITMSIGYYHDYHYHYNHIILMLRMIMILSARMINVPSAISETKVVTAVMTVLACRIFTSEIFITILFIINIMINNYDCHRKFINSNQLS